MQSVSSTKKNTKKRRFSEEQTRSLESIYKSDCRPESAIKQQLANDLGLQPQQVAIWFQNRRARLKSKQIEREYNIMRANYDTLVSRFESLQTEHQSLLLQLQNLKNSLGKQQSSDRNVGEDDQTGNGSDGLCQNSRNREHQPNGMNEIQYESSNFQVDKASRDDGSRKYETTGRKNDIFSKADSTDASITSLEHYRNAEPSSFLDESLCSSLWWELWP